MCNHVTHFLLAIRKMSWECLSQNLQCHPQPVGQRKTYDEAVFHKLICHVAHLLLVIGTDVMRPLLTTWAMSLTPCWSGKDVIRLPFTKCAMTHKLWLLGKDVMRSFGSVTHKLLVIGTDVMRLHCTICTLTSWWSKAMRLITMCAMSLTRYWS